MRPYARWFVFLTVCLLPVQKVLAQHYSYQHYGIEDGLAGAVTHGICQDQDGFIWFTTETGLSRFDGTHFRNFTRDDGLPSNETFSAYCDSRNRVWITSFKNAVCYYYQGKIYTQQTDPVLRSIGLSGELSGFGETSKGEIMLQSVPVFYIIGPDNRISYIGTHRYVAELWKGRTIELYRGMATFRADVLSLPDSMRRVINGQSFEYLLNLDQHPFAQKKSYVFMNGGQALCFFSDGTPHYTVALSRSIKMIKQLSDSVIAFCEYERPGARLYNIYKKQYVAEYLPSVEVNDIFKDRDGNLWFTTMGSGVYKLSAPAPQTYYFVQKKSLLNVLCIRKEKGRIFVGTSKEAYWQLKPESKGAYSHGQWYKPERVKIDFMQHTSAADPFVYCGSSDFLGLNTIDPLRHFRVNVKTFFLSGDTILIAARNGTYLVKRTDPRVRDTLYPNRSTCAYIHKGLIYIGTLNGLYTVDAQRKTTFLGDSNRLFRNRISYFAESPDGTLWIGTYEEGVIGYRNGKIRVNITRRSHGLSSDLCRCLYASGNVLWVGTEKGLNKLDVSRARVRVAARYTVADGLNSDMINAICVDGNNLYTGTPVGLTCFDERKMPAHSRCDIRLTGLYVSGRSRDLRSDSLQLGHNDNNIRFEYAGLSFLSLGNVTYVYRLLGLDTSWKRSTETVLNYPSLPSGNYTLQIFAVNKFNDHSIVLSRHFTIEKTFWEKLWVRITLLLLLITTVCFGTWYLLRRLRKKEQAQRFSHQKMMELEQMALRAQMNPHFIFNCLNSVQRYIMNQDPLGANLYLSRFASLIRQTLENSSKMFVSMAEEITYLSDYIELEQMQVKGRFTYRITVDPLIDQQKTRLPNMVIQAYVENAIKHGVGQMLSDGLITLDFSRTSMHVICTIGDNGPGIDAMLRQKRQDPFHDSKGMSITYRRLETYNQLFPDGQSIGVQVEDLGRADERAHGTRVTLTFPLS